MPTVPVIIQIRVNNITQMTEKQTFYNSIKQIREKETPPYYRVLISGYLNDDQIKKQNINQQKYLKATITPYQDRLTGYLYIKGLFYLHLIQSKNIKHINDYMRDLYSLTLKEPNVHKQIRIVYQSYECPTLYFKNWECDNIVQAGPILVDTDKTQEQIADRSFDIYMNIEEGAKKKLQNSSHKISNMFLLSNDDMQILICKNFMSLEQYNSLYIRAMQHTKECESNYPLPPTIFNTMQFLEIQDYTKYH